MNRLVLTCLASLLTCSLARADLLTGQVVDANGVGVPGVDIDVKNLGSGGDPDIFNDGTNADGFFSTTMPAGLYRVTFTPPPPPASTHLILEVDDVIVVGTTAMGVVQLPAGVSLAGRVLDPLGLPVAGVNVDVIDAAGDNLTLGPDQTGPLGTFDVAVPEGPIELRLDATPVVLQTLASQALDLELSGDTDLGDVSLPQGFTISGTAVGPGQVAVVNADLDFHDASNGSKLYTPKDNTGPTGQFSVVVPAGTWDVVLCPQFDDLLVAVEIDAVPIGADLALGLLQLQAGVVLSGHVTAFDLTPVQGADVDVADSVTGATVALCADNTNGQGNYAVVVPPGTFDLTFTPPGYSLPLGAQELASVSVGGATVVNGTLPSCPLGTQYGTGTAGTGGLVPVLASTGGAPRVGNPGYGFRVSNAVGGSGVFLVIGFGPAALPYQGGTILIDLFLPVFPIGLALSGAPGAAGSGVATLPISIDPTMVGISVFNQGFVIDPGNPTGFAWTNGLNAIFCL